MSSLANSESSCAGLSSVELVANSVRLQIDAENVASSGCPLQESSMQRCCQYVLETQTLLSLKSVAEIELSVQFVGPTDMQALNNQYRGKDSATNVLSFESGFPAVALSDSAGAGNMLALGDLVFCSTVVEAEAEEQGKSLDHHWMHLFVHGTLHLCGYDHEDSDEASTMESLEIQILSDLGIPDPYDIIENQ